MTDMTVKEAYRGTKRFVGRLCVAALALHSGYHKFKPWYEEIRSERRMEEAQERARINEVIRRVECVEKTDSGIRLRIGNNHLATTIGEQVANLEFGSGTYQFRQTREIGVNGTVEFAVGRYSGRDSSEESTIYRQIRICPQ